MKDDFDKETWTGKLFYWTIGDPQPQFIDKPSIHDVTESAAIYRVRRSFERKTAGDFMI